MDINKYISSGILEQYVLGMASDAERQEVEKYAQEYPEIRKELDAIEVAMEQYAQVRQLPTPAGVEAKFNQKIDELIAKNPPTSSPNEDKKTGGMWLPLLLAVALMASGWWGFSNYQNLQNSETQLTNVTNQLATLQSDCNETNNENEALKNRIRILQDPDNQVTKMTGENALASVIWNPQTKKSYLSIKNLPTPPADRDYQLWALVDGKPVNMDVFQVTLDAEGLLEVPFIENAGAFAVTLETKGGNPTPNLDALVMIGNV